MIDLTDIIEKIGVVVLIIAFIAVVGGFWVLVIWALIKFVFGV